MDMILKKYGVEETPETKRCTHSVDRALLRVEWDALINDINGYGLGVDMSGVQSLHLRLDDFWSPEEAERLFLNRFNELYQR